MALLGMGSNMESNGCFRHCCLTREIVDDELLNRGRFSNTLFPPLEFNKGVLKQIMLEHESIFRDQIYELHRLYRRQKDLMTELKLCKYDQHGERTQPNTESESKCRKFGKKKLDLELPAEEYIDSEEEWPVKEDVVPIVLPKDHDTSVLPRFYELLSSTLSGKLKILADLNEPVEIEDEAASETPPQPRGSEFPSYNDENEPEKSEKAGGSYVSLNCDTKSEDERVLFGESDRKLLPFGTRFDLNRLGNEDGSSFVDERSSCPRPGQDDRSLQEELVRIAAEAMICISSSDHRTPPRGSGFHLWETHFESLRWFSQIVCSTTADNESKVKSASKSKNSGEGKGDKPSSNQPPKIRKTRGRQRRDPQSKMLPGSVALSMREAAEDLQISGGLMEVAKRGTNRLFRRKRQSRLTGSLIKLLSGNGKLGSDDESRVGWGRIRRRRRGRRCPARNPQLILEQIL